MNTFDTLTTKSRLTDYLKDSRESILGKPLLSFLGAKATFLNVQFREEVDRFTWQIELPGMSKENLCVRIEGHTMWVYSRNQLTDHDFIINPLVFSHSFGLPAMADREKVAAFCRGVVLRVTIGKLKPKPFRKKIRVGGDDHYNLMGPMTSFWKSLGKRAADI
jgi:HSP20 family molecular chaperone IbpA